jgi:hypothetical protein
MGQLSWLNSGFCCLPVHLEQLCLLPNDTGAQWPDVKLTIHLHLLSELRIRGGAMRLFPLCFNDMALYQPGGQFFLFGCVRCSIYILLFSSVNNKWLGVPGTATA